MSAPQIPFPLRSSPALGRNDFFVGECNELALHWVEIWPKGWEPFPALIIYGPRGSGKSHLADVWCNRANAIKWNDSNINNIATDDIMSVTQNIVIDRIDALIGNRENEEKLFHLYNHFQQNKLYFLGLSQTAPEDMNFCIKDLGSRLRAAPHTAIFTPDDDVLSKVMAKRFHDQGYIVSPATLQFAMTRMDRSWESLDHLIENAINYASAQKKTITIPLIREVI